VCGIVEAHGSKKNRSLTAELFAANCSIHRNGAMTTWSRVWFCTIALAVGMLPAARGGAVTEVAVTISTNLNTALLDPVLVYAWIANDTINFGAAPLGPELPPGIAGPFTEAVPTPGGFTSGSATLLGLYANASNPGGCPALTPCGVGMIFNTTAGTAAIGSEDYTTAFPNPNPYPTESQLAAEILEGGTLAGQETLEAFYQATTERDANSDWVTFTLGQTAATVDVVLFSNAASGGSLTIDSVTTATPEPATLVLVGAGIAAFVAKRRLRPQLRPAKSIRPASRNSAR
jgi:hypothetical protein